MKSYYYLFLKKINLKSDYHYKIYPSISSLPTEWDALSKGNLFLSTHYFKTLEVSKPSNMTCYYIGIFENNLLVGIVLAQIIDLNSLKTLGNRDHFLSRSIRDFLIKNFASRVLFIGNNMLTGQNAMLFDEKCNKYDCQKTLEKAVEDLEILLKKTEKKVHITVFKDFSKNDLIRYNLSSYENFHVISAQPNMIFCCNNNWTTFNDYIDSLSKKYRDQYKRASKKCDLVVKKDMQLLDIKTHEDKIYDLYFHVASNAPFNTFFLNKNHFYELKKTLEENFILNGYFIEDELIGFYSLFKNNTTIETYFLGYDDILQKDKMLYLNMLYDMISYSINRKFQKIIFSRTALEIKSSVGAKSEEMFGFIKHHNPFINNVSSM
jgi:hypothetical protein